MAIQILPRRIDPLSDIGAGIGEGIEGGFDILRQRQQQQQQIQKTYQGLIAQGIPHQKAAFLAQQHPELIKQYLSQEFTSLENRRKEAFEMQKELEKENLALAREERKEKLSLEKEQRGREHQEMLARESANKDFRAQVTDEYKASRENLRRLNDMEKLINEGKLGTAGWHSALRAFGLDIPALKGASAEEYDKIAAEFVRGAKSVFGSRITDADLRAFFRMIPTLENTEDGKRRIIQAFRAIEKGKAVQFNTMRKIYKEQKNPWDLREQTLESVIESEEGESAAKEFENALGVENIQKQQQNIQSGSQYPEEFNSAISGTGQILSPAARAAERILGGPANLAQFGTDLAVGGLRKVGQGIENLVGQIPGFEPTSEMMNQQQAAENAYQRGEGAAQLPFTSDWIRNAERAIFGNWLEPNNKASEFVGNTVGRIAELSNPFMPGDITKKAAAAIGIGSEVLGFLTEKVSGNKELGEAAANVATIGSVLGVSAAKNLGFTNKLQASKKAGYDMAEKEIAKNSYYVPKIEKAIKKVQQDLKHGLENVPENAKIKNIVKDAFAKIKDHKMHGKDILKAKQQLNELIYNTSNTSAQTKYLNDIVNPFRSTLDRIAKTNPQFGIPYGQAESLHKGLVAASEWKGPLERAVKILPGWLKDSKALPYIMYLYPLASGLALGGDAGINALARLQTLWSKSPEARKMIMQSFNQLAKDNTKGFVTVLGKMAKSKEFQDIAE